MHFVGMLELVTAAADATAHVATPSHHAGGTEVILAAKATDNDRRAVVARRVVAAPLRDFGGADPLELNPELIHQTLGFLHGFRLIFFLLLFRLLLGCGRYTATRPG